MDYCSNLTCYQLAVPNTSLCREHSSHTSSSHKKHSSGFLPARPTLQPNTAQREEQRQFAKQVYEAHRAELLKLQRVELLKRIDALTAEAFFQEMKFSSQQIKQVKQVVIESNMAGVEENSDRFFKLLGYKTQRMSLCRDVVVLSLSDTEHSKASGFNDFERLLLIGCCHISQAYDTYFLSWQKEANHPDVQAAVDSQDPLTLRSREDCKHLDSPYTMVRVRSKGSGFEFMCEPYSVFFESLLDPVLNAFDVCIQSLSEFSEAAQHAKVNYLRQYRKALAEPNPDHLEGAWELTDRLWMDTKDSLQVVHDIEDGYSDPLRVKQTPDFSLRVLDETRGKENDEIKEIQRLMCKYYKGRDTPIGKAGLTALANTLAGIYYIPFTTGASLVFAYSGQSLPNRLQVTEEKGVKIFFDVIETEKRVEQVKAKVPVVYKDGEALLQKFKPDAVDILVWHVAAHEVGHAIYGISTMKKHVKRDVVALLEEPRAELTAMFTLRLLHREGKLSDEELQRHVLAFALDGVRYFAKFKSQPMQAYIIFQIHAYNTYLKHKMFEWDHKQITVDASKVPEVLDDFSNLFEEILSCCDKQNQEGGQGLEKILQTMRKMSPFVEEVVSLLNDAGGDADSAE